MKVLLDSCVWSGTKKTLEDAGHDTLWIGDFLRDPGDEVIIKLAYREDRILVTLDKEFLAQANLTHYISIIQANPLNLRFIKITND